MALRESQGSMLIRYELIFKVNWVRFSLRYVFCRHPRNCCNPTLNPSIGEHHSYQSLQRHYPAFIFIFTLVLTSVSVPSYLTRLCKPFSHLYIHTHTHTHAIRSIQVFDNGCSSSTSSGWPRQKSKIGSQCTYSELWQLVHRRCNKDEKGSSNRSRAGVLAGKGRHGVW